MNNTEKIVDSLVSNKAKSLIDTAMDNAYALGYQAATAEADKIVAELKTEIAGYHLNYKDVCLENLDLKDYINVLREALEEIVGGMLTKAINNETIKNTTLEMFAKEIKQALESTPAQSLQAHDDEVIERCAKACENLITESFSKPLSFDDIAIAIRALKGKYE